MIYAIVAIYLVASFLATVAVWAACAMNGQPTPADRLSLGAVAGDSEQVIDANVHSLTSEKI